MEYARMEYPSLSDPSTPPYDMPSASSKNELIKEHAGPVEKRKPTNVEFLWLFGAIVVLWFLTCFYCMYNGDLSRLDIELSSNATSLLKELAYNVKAGSGEIYLACSSAVVFSALLIILFRRYAGTIVWFVLGLVLTGLAVGMVSSWYFYSKVIPVEQNSTSDLSYSSSSNDNSDTSSLLTTAIMTTIFFFVGLIIIYAIRKHIRMVIILFKEGGKVTQSMPFILAQPFVIFVGLVITLFLAFYFALWIATAGEIVKDDMGNVRLEKDGLMMFAVWFHVLVVWWIIQFLIGCQNMVIAGATATWYFTRDKARIGNAITTSYKYLFKYHLGSVALGSLIITAIQFFRAMYQATMRKNSRNFIGCLLSALFKYIEKFITFLTRNAYIEIAIYGDGLFVSGKRAFRVLTHNAIKVATINSVGDFVMILGRCLVTALAVLIGYLLLQGKESVPNIEYPLTVIAIVSFAIVHAFMLAFEMIVDSVFICFCEDCDINDGVQRPYYMSEQLRVFVNEDQDPKTLRVGDAAVA